MSKGSCTQPLLPKGLAVGVFPHADATVHRLDVDYRNDHQPCLDRAVASSYQPEGSTH